MTASVRSSSTISATLQSIGNKLSRIPFDAPALLRNGHAMTIFCNLKPRRISLETWPHETRFFQTEPETRVVTFCHWQPDRHSHPTVIIVHGLEGNADREYVRGAAEKALRAGFNVIRQNVRNCGGTEHLTPTLYHSGFTTDLAAIVRELIEQDGLPEIYLIGFSMGGNQTLKFAGELGDNAPPQLRGVAAISPAMDLAACCDAISQPQCWIYEQRFLRSLRARLKLKNELFPGRIDVERGSRARSLREFDDVITGPFFGFGDANGYYAQASSRPLLRHIRVPALMITAQDDPFIPYEPFLDPTITANPHLLLLAPAHGGHVGFYGNRPADQREDNYWAEARAVEFCSLLAGSQ